MNIKICNRCNSDIIDDLEEFASANNLTISFMCTQTCNSPDYNLKINGKVISAPNFNELSQKILSLE